MISTTKLIRSFFLKNVIRHKMLESDIICRVLKHKGHPRNKDYKIKELTTVHNWIKQ